MTETLSFVILDFRNWKLFDIWCLPVGREFGAYTE